MSPSRLLLAVALPLYACAEPPASAVLGDGACADPAHAVSYDTHFTDPVMNGALTHPEQPAALMYYAVDTAEPYMQVAVDHEIKQLREVCVPENSAVNWVVFANSHYVARAAPVFALCKAGHYSEEAYPAELLAKLEDTRAAVRDFPENPADAGDRIRYRTKYPADLAASFFQFPLAHPDFLGALMGYARKTLFPADQYGHFIHLKSHGSTKLLLTGLTTAQTQAKTDCQKAALAQAGIAVDGLGDHGLGDAGLGDHGLGDHGLGDHGLGDHGLGDHGLGDHGPGDDGLGTIGLGIANHFGLAYGKMPQLLTDHLLTQEPKGDVGFLLLESCESRMKEKTAVVAYQSTLPLRAYYSAVGSLWYRNLDWDDAWRDALAHGGDAGALQAALVAASKQFRNYVVKEQP